MSKRVEVWIRQAGTRRQAFYRTTTGGWRPLSVPAADKALRRGTITVGGLVDAIVVPRETHDGVRDALDAMRGEFAATATRLNADIDAPSAPIGNVPRETRAAGVAP